MQRKGENTAHFICRIVALHLSYICFFLAKKRKCKNTKIRQRQTCVSLVQAHARCRWLLLVCLWLIYTCVTGTQWFKKEKIQQCEKAKTPQCEKVKIQQCENAKTRQIRGESTTRNMYRIVAHFLSYFRFFCLENSKMQKHEDTRCTTKSNFVVFSHFALLYFEEKKAKIRNGVTQPWKEN